MYAGIEVPFRDVIYLLPILQLLLHGSLFILRLIYCPSVDSKCETQTAIDRWSFILIARSCLPHIDFMTSVSQTARAKSEPETRQTRGVHSQFSNDEFHSPSRNWLDLNQGDVKPTPGWFQWTLVDQPYFLLLFAATNFSREENLAKTSLVSFESGNSKSLHNLRISKCSELSEQIKYECPCLQVARTLKLTESFQCQHKRQVR